MPRKSLERLTFTYLKAFDASEAAREACENLPIVRNRMIFIEAEGRLLRAHRQLEAAVKPTSLVQYMQEFQALAGQSIKHLLRNEAQG